MEFIFVYIIASVIALIIMYFVIKAAVRNGINESQLVKQGYDPTPDADGYVPVRE